jgi:hypothetical protein
MIDSEVEQALVNDCFRAIRWDGEEDEGGPV